MAVMVLLKRKGADMAKIVANSRIAKTAVLRRRAYKLRQSGFGWPYIAKKLGIKEAKVQALVLG